MRIGILRGMVCGETKSKDSIAGPVGTLGHPKTPRGAQPYQSILESDSSS